MSRTQLAAREYVAYRTLWKHDREWMQSHLPERLPSKGHRRYGDLDDAAFLERLRVAHAGLTSPGGLPVMVTANLLRERAGLHLINNHVARLPECVAFIERHVDEQRSFWDKRFAWGIAELSGRGTGAGWQEFIDLIRFRPQKTPALLPDARAAYGRLTLALGDRA